MDDVDGGVRVFGKITSGMLTDLAEEGGGVGRTAAESVLQVWLEAIDVAVGAALARGGEDLVEVGAQVVVHGLAVPAQAAGNRADRPAAFARLVDVGVPLADAGQ
ncbi:hypothetical protein [Streptomyces sp. XY332]|uniref:hypothetical protein n=1 Tax=Streptomyces sp. XY332 TaxID=1415561 RepID=UPI0006B1E75A|nr:hypothetical protein [Streptomyces sp. XY332]